VSFVPDHAGADMVASPNRTPRRSGHLAPDLVILHYTGMASGEAALALLCDPASGVSAHYVVFEDGRIVQSVPERERAWHAGLSSWHGSTDINSRSIGIEIVNGGHDFGLPPFPDVQIAAVCDLLAGILARHGIAPRGVLGHSDIAPDRKRDPGEHFPWQTLAGRGVAWPAPAPARRGSRGYGPGDKGPAVARLQDALWRAGYGGPVDGVYGATTEAIVAAVQRRYRPHRVNGKADRITRGLIAALTAQKSA
jgi:N-acetylmuramoyl-L-alanine amidase